MYKGFEQLRKELKEDVAVNSVGGGAIAGIGVGSRGEPGFSRKTKPKMLRRKALGAPIKECSGKRILATESENDGALTFNVPALLRTFEVVREHIKTDDELHKFTEELMNVGAKTLTMSDIETIMKKYGD